jgi:hypothetical protein
MGQQRPFDADVGHSWAVYSLNGTPMKFLGIVYGEPTQEAAIKRAIEQFNLPADRKDQLVATRRD